MKLDTREELWLTAHGDRDIRHVHEDEVGKYVLMYHPFFDDKVEKVYFTKKLALEEES